MIRLIFRTLVDGRFKYHTATVSGHDVDLLATDKTAEYVGAELVCVIEPSRIANSDLPGKISETINGICELRQPVWSQNIPWINRTRTAPDLSQVSISALKDEIELRQIVEKRTHNPPETPTSEIGSDGGFVVPPDLVPSLEKVVFEDRRAMSPDELGKAEELGKAIAESMSERRKSKESPGVLYGEGLKSQLWLFRRPSGEFVKSTTEEGGESYIACTSLDEAQKVVEQQKIYDIDCVPHRVF